tara:strand:- start:893 stop:1264 length:372 start_codon:yes stop_codon:yes gene_type:complete
MPLDTAKPNHSHVAEYQQSSIPWLQELVAANNTQVNFPYVTRYIVISNPSDTAVQVAFSSTGNANSQYIKIPPATVSPRLELKVKSIWVTHAGGKEVNILAGLTNVKAADFPDITGLDGIVGA